MAATSLSDMADTHSIASLKQRLRFELLGLDNRDLEAAAVGGIRTVLQGLRSKDAQIKAALQELLSGLATCSKNAVKLRLQLAEYCILKCMHKRHLPGLLPYLTKQANLVLANNRNDGICISSLAALMSSCLAKLLHEPQQDGQSCLETSTGECAHTAHVLCEALLFPMIRSTYRDPEQARISAGSVVLLGLLDVLKAYAQQFPHAVDALQHCLKLMVHLLGTGSIVQRVPGVLQPVSTCLGVIGGSIDKDCTKRLVQLCMKGAATKDAWQVRRDALQMLAVLTANVLGSNETVESNPAEAMQLQLLHISPPLHALMQSKAQVMQMLERVRYDKIAAVRVAAVAAYAKYMGVPNFPLLPQSPVREDAEACTAPQGTGKQSSRRARSMKRKLGQSLVLKPAQSSATSSGGQRHFTKPKPTPGVVMDFGIQVFAPPSPRRQPTPQQAVSPPPSQDAVAQEVGHDQTPTRRKLDFEEDGKGTGSLSRLLASKEAASQTCQTCGPAPQSYTVQSPLPGMYMHHLHAVGGVAESPVASAGIGQLHPSDALQMVDQNQQPISLASMLAAGAGGISPRLDVSHHVHGRVALDITYNASTSPPLHHATAMRSTGPSGMADFAAAVAAGSGLVPDIAPGVSAAGFANAVSPNNQQNGRARAAASQILETAREAATSSCPGVAQQHACVEPSFAVMPEEYQPPSTVAAAESLADGVTNCPCACQPQMLSEEADTTKPDSRVHEEAYDGSTAVSDNANNSSTESTAAGVQHTTLQDLLSEDHSDSGSSVCASEDQPARRLRQRWQIPGPEQQSMARVVADVMPMSVAATLCTEAHADDSPPRERVLRCSSTSSQSQERSNSRQSRQSPTTSLEVLRNVGARVQGLLEALSRQTSSISRHSNSCTPVDGRQTSVAGSAVEGATAPINPAGKLDPTYKCATAVKAAPAVAGGLGDLVSCFGTASCQPTTPVQAQSLPLAAVQLQTLQCQLVNAEQPQEQQGQRTEAVQQASDIAESFQLAASHQSLSQHNTLPEAVDGTMPAEIFQYGCEQPSQQVPPVAIEHYSQQPAHHAGFKSSMQPTSHCVASMRLQAGAVEGDGVVATTAVLQSSSGDIVAEGVEQHPLPRGQQQAQQHDEAYVVPEIRMSMQFNQLFQTDHAEPATSADAAGASSAAVHDVLNIGQPDAVGAASSSAGVVQVERALQKLQTLRNTLQSISGSASSSRQHSLSADLSSTYFQASCSSMPAGLHIEPEGPNAVLNGCSADAGQAPDKAATTSGSQQSAERGSALTKSTRDWIKQISERLQQVGNSGNVQAATVGGYKSDTAPVASDAPACLKDSAAANMQDSSPPSPRAAETAAMADVIADAGSPDQPVRQAGSSSSTVNSPQRLQLNTSVHGYKVDSCEEPWQQQNCEDNAVDSTCKQQQPQQHNYSNMTLPAVSSSPLAVQATKSATERLQQMLDASDDSALLMSLALKLSMLARKFKGKSCETIAMGLSCGSMPQLASSPVKTAQSWASNATQASVVSASSSPSRWTTVRDNDLYVCSPFKQAPGSSPAARSSSCQQILAATAEHLGSIDGTLAVGSPADAAPACEQAAPCPDVFNAALQRVLGLSLQELQDCDEQAVSTASHAILQLQQRLTEYGERPIAGAVPGLSPCGTADLQASMQLLKSTADSRMQLASAGVRRHLFQGGPASRHVNEQKVQPVLVLLMYDLGEAVREFCMQHYLQQEEVDYGWEALAEAAAEQQLQWFTNQHMQRLVNLLIAAF